MLDTFEPVVRFLAQYQGDDYVKGWAELWDKGDLIDWDKGFPNPALEDTLIQRRSIIGDPVVKDAWGSQYRRKALVPGCGRGVDVLLLASFGYDAYGLEYSHSAVETCKKEESKRGGRYPIRNPEFGRGSVTFLQGDFFDDAWLDALGLLQNAFDLVYDHSFFCALDPSLRPRWALRQTQLLVPNGHLVCLEYPRHRNPSEMGPPWTASSEDYWKHLTQPGEDVFNSKNNPIDNGLVRVGHWQPDRTHENGKDASGNIQDRVAIWCRSDKARETVCKDC